MGVCAGWAASLEFGKVVVEENKGDMVRHD